MSSTVSSGEEPATLEEAEHAALQRALEAEDVVGSEVGGLVEGDAAVVARGEDAMLRHMLYGTYAIEPAVYAQLAALVLLVAALAAWVPARRAIGRDPVRTLRE